VRKKTPHNELIIVRRFNNKREYSFDPTKTSWRRLGDNSFRFFDLNRVIDAASLDMETDIFKRIRAQHIDIFGKCRILWFVGGLWGFLNTPTAPCSLPIIEEPDLPASSSLDRFLRETNTIVTRRFRTEELLFCEVRIGENVLLLFPARIDDDQSTVEITTSPPSLLMDFIRADVSDRYSVIKQSIRMAGIVQDYCLYFFSEFIDKNKDKITETTKIEDWIDIFIDEYTLNVSDDYEYPPVDDIPAMFHNNVRGLVSDGKIYMAERVRIKFLYILKWFFIRRFEFIQHLRLMKEIPSYFIYISDFEKTGHQIIVTSPELATRTPLPFITTTDTSTMKYDVPTYLFNGVDRISLICKTRRKEHAMAILREWSARHVFVPKPSEDGVLTENTEVGQVMQVSGGWIADLNLSI
jgi:hypothetical protein